MTDQDFEKKVKNSFLKVKEDINKIENEILELKNLINSQKEQIDLIFSKIEKISIITEKEDENNKHFFKSSNGNKGVCAHMQTHMQTPVHIPVHINDRENLQKANFDSLTTVDKSFLGLTKKEFLIYLTLYQLEDDIGKVTYDDISKYLKLTSGCIRTHIGHIIMKNIPISREKINNKLTLLSIPQEFRQLNLKTRLMNIYNNQDPYQKKLI